MIAPVVMASRPPGRPKKEYPLTCFFRGFRGAESHKEKVEAHRAKLQREYGCDVSTAMALRDIIDGYTPPESEPSRDWDEVLP